LATRQDITAATTTNQGWGHNRATKFKCDFDAIAAFQYAAFGMDATDGRDWDGDWDGYERRNRSRSRHLDSNWIGLSQRMRGSKAP